MNRPSILAFLALALASAACSGGSEKPGAMFRGPAALAIFQGRVTHDDGGLHPYLAVANVRGDELRLVHLDDDEVVESPGLAFPLSVPVEGRPMLVASADMNEATKPSALAVVEAGAYVPGLAVANVLDLIDTWNGFTQVATQVTLATDGEVLAVAPAAVPDGLGGRLADRARFVVALTGGRLEIVELTRGTGNEIVATRLASPLSGLPFDVSSLSQGADPGFIYAGSMDGNPGFGLAKIALPADLTGWSATAPGTVTWYETGLPIEHIAAVTYDFWDVGTGSYGASTERVVAVPTASACLTVCGMLLVNPSTGALAAGWAPSETTLLPMSLPAPVTGVVAAGRAASALMPLVSGAGTVNTTAVAVFTATDGGIYFVDLAHWAIASDTSPLVGTGRTRASSASVYGGTIGLSDGSGTTVDPALLPARVKVTPGFTADEDWTLTWQGILPGLDGRGGRFRRSGATRTVAVQVGTGPVFEQADLVALGVKAGDAVGVLSIDPYCIDFAVATATADPTGNQVEVTVPTGSCLETVPDGADVPITLAIRASGLVLTGAKTGYVGRPTPGAPFTFAGTRQFYVTDPCTSTECTANWPGLTFPFPSGAALELTAELIGTPAQDDHLHFTTKSGVTPAARRPVVDGKVIASPYPAGLALRDKGGSGVGVLVHASYTAGVVVILSSAAAANTMSVIR